jgi:hypothetical protein
MSLQFPVNYELQTVFANVKIFLSYAKTKDR